MNGNKIFYKVMVRLVQDLSNIKKIVNEEGLDVLVVSYGGSCSNTLVNTLQKNGYKCRSKMFDRILCHCPHYIELDIPIIYIYDNPISALLSMKRRGLGIWGTNQRKLSNNRDIKLEDENLLKLMIKQYNNWKGHNDVLFVKTNELFEKNILIKLKKFLKNDELMGFPIELKEKKTKLNEFDMDIVKVIEKYLPEIKKINLE